MNFQRVLKADKEMTSLSSLFRCLANELLRKFSFPFLSFSGIIR
uniref:Uncharacterized protein n=1 Tax=Arundo donax TaxID=35708 RepID=A0A0A8XVT0_ARUDO